MTDHKFTDEQTIKALDHCRNGDRGSKCSKCEYVTGCKPWLIGLALDLINRQMAEIARLKKYYFTHDYHECHNEAIKEFADKLKEELTTGAAVMRVSTLDIIDRLVKEITEEKTE